LTEIITKPEQRFTLLVTPAFHLSNQIMEIVDGIQTQNLPESKKMNIRAESLVTLKTTIKGKSQEKTGWLIIIKGAVYTHTTSGSRMSQLYNPNRSSGTSIVMFLSNEWVFPANRTHAGNTSIARKKSSNPLS
jgi:DNA integrity scanning protein DisA with diadenylate cyclase activity